MKFGAVVRITSAAVFLIQKFLLNGRSSLLEEKGFQLDGGNYETIKLDT
jgi:hypothetical protein